MKPIRSQGAAASISRGTSIAPSTPSGEDESSLDHFPMDEEAGDGATTPTDTLRDSNEPLALLTKLKSSFRADEFELYALLKETTIPHLNDVRKAFNDASKSAKNRLSAWSKKASHQSRTFQTRRTSLHFTRLFSYRSSCFPRKSIRHQRR